MCCYLKNIKNIPLNCNYVRASGQQLILFYKNN
uniref:Uncharacterized protein n=1 Tax=Siphoviridae sp. cttaA39 TaxID=2827960 RepID=A0A8S5TMU1_9CAUD|nr:MAG TPA: hypothetical protein [Siphoviridae sp. cttaA39]